MATHSSSTAETAFAPATAEQVEAAWRNPKLANVLYHDWEAGTYDEKWSISFDQRCIDYARDRFAHVAGSGGWPYGRALELGCGTGFFLLNLKLAGVIDSGAVTDLSPGMVEVAVRNAKGLGFDVEGRVADAESIPYEDNSFDLVVGHAVLHHIPDVEQALREVLRVLKPGGVFMVLEFYRPTTLLMRIFHSIYARFVLPGIGSLVSRDHEAYAYLARSMQGFYSRAEFTELAQKVGFQAVESEDLSLGIASLFRLVKG